MGLGLAFTVAAYAAYNFLQAERREGKPGRKKIVAIEGNSALGFSGTEMEYMAHFQNGCIHFRDER